MEKKAGLLRQEFMEKVKGVDDVYTRRPQAFLTDKPSTDRIEHVWRSSYEGMNVPLEGLKIYKRTVITTSEVVE